MMGPEGFGAGVQAAEYGAKARSVARAGGIGSRVAAYWERREGEAIGCTLCYRRCVLKPEETGWCGYRKNTGGRMELLANGVIAYLIFRRQGHYGAAAAMWRPG